jgi:hypothetical protein
MHTGRGIVVRENGVVSRMMLGKFRCSAYRISRLGHILCRIETLVGGAIQLTSKSPRLIIIQPSCVILKVQD